MLNLNSTACEPKTEAEIAELAKNEDFIVLAAQYLESQKWQKELREEIEAMSKYPKIMRIAIERLLHYSEGLTEAEIALDVNGWSVSDVYAWQYDSIMKEKSAG